VVAQIEHWSQFERGGHFPAMAVLDLLVTGTVREFFRNFGDGGRPRIDRQPSTRGPTAVGRGREAG
jgi:hypothetical protein